MPNFGMPCAWEKVVDPTFIMAYLIVDNELLENTSVDSWVVWPWSTLTITCRGPRTDKFQCVKQPSVPCVEPRHPSVSCNGCNYLPPMSKTGSNYPSNMSKNGSITHQIWVRLDPSSYQRVTSLLRLLGCHTVVSLCGSVTNYDRPVIVSLLGAFRYCDGLFFAGNVEGKVSIYPFWGPRNNKDKELCKANTSFCLVCN